jgi:hypothetical protein
MQELNLREAYEGERHLTFVAAYSVISTIQQAVLSEDAVLPAVHIGPRGTCPHHKHAAQTAAAACNLSRKL